MESLIKTNEKFIRGQVDMEIKQDDLFYLIFVDNYILIISLYLFVLPYIIKSCSSDEKCIGGIKPNYWTIIIIPVIILVHLIIKFIYLTQSNYNIKIRTEQCLKVSNKLAKRDIIPVEKNINLLDKPLYEFFIASSHNTYIPCTQNFDVASSDAIKRTLQLGARVIELDCYAKNSLGDTNNPDDMTPMVAHGRELQSGDIFTTQMISFAECLDVILSYGFETSDPLIICLELNTHMIKPVQKQMANLIKTRFSKRLLSPEYKLVSGSNRKYFSLEPIKNLLNKVIFVSGKGITSELFDIIDGQFNTSDYLNNNSNEDLFNKTDKKIIQRVYPAGNLTGHLSLNFDPVKYWKLGYQMIALNYQMLDESMIKNLAFFKTNSLIHYSQIN